MPEGDRLAFDVVEAAELLQVGPRSVYGLIRTGRLRAVRVGRLWRVPRGALDEYLQGSQVVVERARLARLRRLESAWELVKELRRRGIELFAEGGRLRYRAADVNGVAPELRRKMERYGNELKDLHLLG
jgi:excisionase family DNA binding protein